MLGRRSKRAGPTLLEKGRLPRSSRLPYRLPNRYNPPNRGEAFCLTRCAELLPILEGIVYESVRLGIGEPLWVEHGCFR